MILESGKTYQVRRGEYCWTAKINSGEAGLMYETDGISHEFDDIKRSGRGFLRLPDCKITATFTDAQVSLQRMSPRVAGGLG